MRRRLKPMNTKLLIVLSLFLSINNAQAHKVISAKMENLWGTKGVIHTLFQTKEKNSIKNQVFDQYLSKNMSQIINDRMWFFTLSENDYSMAEVWLDSMNTFYVEDLSTYNKIHQNDVILSSMSVSSVASSTICDNIDFETGLTPSAFFSNWTIKLGIACPGFGCNGFYIPSTPISMPLNDFTTHFSLTNSGSDPNIPGSVLSAVKPGGSYSFRLENGTYGGDATMLTRSISVDASKPFFKYSFAAVLEDPGSSHLNNEKPYFKVVIKDASGDVIKCSDYLVIANPANQELKENFIYDNSTGADLYYRNWTDVVVPLDDYVGQNVVVEFVVSDCSWGGHMAYVYLDGDCFNPTLTIDSCAGAPISKRKISAPSGFLHYSWTGPDIKGSNANQDLYAGKGGNYTVRLASRNGCYGFRDVSVANCNSVAQSCSLTINSIETTSCNSNDNTFNVTGVLNVTSSFSNGLIVVTLGTISKIFYAPFGSSFSFTFNNIRSGQGSLTLTAKYFNRYFLGNPVCEVSTGVNSPNSCVTVPNFCENCIGSFQPIVGKTYIVSAWVKQEGASDTLSKYTNPYIQISYNSGATMLSPVYASGLIIEGWQRIYYEFTIPSGTTEISIGLKTMSGTASFDDIRVHPIDAGFTSYVYDPISLKLVAVLDDNNYATFYEYDQEGTLIRTKKETVRGVVTITESRENNPKR